MLSRLGRWLASAVGTVVVICLGGLIVASIGIFAYVTLSDDSPPGVSAPAENLLDLPYARDSAQQRLDLYLPERTGKAVPLVIDIHGGAYAGGDKRDETQNVQRLVADGFAVAAIDYRLSGEAKFPASLRDARAAVRWLRANAHEYGLDGDRFGVWGFSAGGWLGSLLAVTADARTLSDGTVLDDGTDPNRATSVAVQAVVAWYAPSDFLTMDEQWKDPGGCPGTPQLHDPEGSPESMLMGAPIRSVVELVRAAAPASYAQAGLPPFLLVHGAADCVVPKGQSLQFQAALAAAGVDVTLHLVEGGGHADGKVYGDQLGPSIAWIEEQLRA
ncbi:alpha/beta fold hydrolase [Spongisporangium articulatum]|uniref:Alpha/beta fold hydrolase n=1 Tax=Spongisporangium articulatum TaxID=3362603 RepID=A0ABW8AH16_9ACTN